MKTAKELGLEYLQLGQHIKNRCVLEFVMESFNYVKEEFFYIPASSSGKYHPSYALGVGGLLKHTKAAIIIADQLFSLYPELKSIQKDYVKAALALHDVEKPSYLHPIEVKLTLEPLRNNKVFDKVIPLIESHMGNWDNHGKLPRPKTGLQKLVHLCDYVASRNVLHIDV